MNKTELCKVLENTSRTALSKTLKAMGWNKKTDFSPEEVEEIRGVRERITLEGEGYDSIAEEYGTKDSQSSPDSKQNEDGNFQDIIDKITAKIGETINRSVNASHQKAVQQVAEEYFKSPLAAETLFKELGHQMPAFEERMLEYIDNDLTFTKTIEAQAEEVKEVEEVETEKIPEMKILSAGDDIPDIQTEEFKP